VARNNDYIRFDPKVETSQIKRMSTQEIIDELPKLNYSDLLLIREKLAQLEAEVSGNPKTGWGKALAEFAGTAEDLPPDLSINHDHYLYGTPKQE